MQYSKSRGWAALFAGLRPCLAATAVSQGLYFYFYSALRQAVVVSWFEGEAGWEGWGQRDGA